MVDLDVKVVPQLDKRLGRQKVHDPRSRRFSRGTSIDRSTWRSRAIKIYDPPSNPSQCHGECTGTTKCMQLNASGNRIEGKILGMEDAHVLYTFASHNDPWDGGWPPSDTGSSGLASAMGAQVMGLGGSYTWIFNGADGVVQSIMDDETVSVGTWWTEDMMTPNSKNIIEPTGKRVGGHQYLARGYNAALDLVMIRCWWGAYRDVFIKRSHLNDLLLDDGDAHTQRRKR